MGDSMFPPIVGYVRMDVAQAIAGMEALAATTKASTAAMKAGTESSAASMNAWNRETAAATSAVSTGLLVVGAGLAVAAAASIKMAADYESATNRLVTSAGESRKNLDLVRTGMLDLAGQVGYSAMELARAMYTVESASFHGADGLKVLRAAAEGAKAENADLKVVADAVTSAMIDYHLKAGAAAQVTTTLIAAVSQGKTTFAELTGSLHSVLPVASAYHVSLVDITAAVASMTVHGMSADQATQNLAHTIQHLGTTSAPQAKELAALGLSARQLSVDLGTKGLTGTLQEISTAIQTRMGPDGLVVLNLQQALAKLPPEVQKLGAAAAAGTISMGDYTKAAKSLSVEAGGQAQAFATLLKATHGIGQDQKSGAEIVQAYAAALKAATGDSTTLNTALMLTGENASYTTGAVSAVSAAVTEAGGHVSGWASIQATFNQRLTEAKDGLEAAAIGFGTRLLPMASAALGVLAAHIPDIVAAGNALVDVAVAVGRLVSWLGPALPLIGGAVALFVAWRAAMTIGLAIEGVVVAAQALSAGLVVLSGTEGIAAAAQWALNIAMDANPIGLVVLAVAALVAGIVILVRHWKQATDAVTAFHVKAVQVAAALVTWAEAHRALAVAITMVLGPIAVLALGAALVITHWSQLVGFFGVLEAAIVKFFAESLALAERGWSEFSQRPLYWVGYLVVAVPILLGELLARFNFWIGEMVNRAFAWGVSMVPPAIKAGADLNQAFQDEIGKLPGQMWSIGVAIVNGLIDGFKSQMSMGIGAVGQFVQGMVDAARAAAGHPRSPAPATVPIGVALAQGLEYGVRSGGPGARGAMSDLIGGMSSRGILSPAGQRGLLPPAGQGNLLSPAGQGTLVGATDMSDTNELLHALYVLLEERLQRAPGAGFSVRAYGPA